MEHVHKFVLTYGFDNITEGIEHFDTAEQAHFRVLFLGSAISIGFAQEAHNSVREHGRFDKDGEWFELRNGAEYCSSHAVAIV